MLATPPISPENAPLVHTDSLAPRALLTPDNGYVTSEHHIRSLVNPPYAAGFEATSRPLGCADLFRAGQWYLETLKQTRERVESVIGGSSRYHYGRRSVKRTVMDESHPEQLRRLARDKRWDHAVALLRWLDPTIAGDAFMSLSFEDQQRLFRAMPIDLAVTLVENLPYFQVYVLLRLRSTRDVHAILDAINPFARSQLYEDLPSDAWRRLLEAETHGPTAPAIVEAKQIEKTFRQPEGAMVQVIAPIDLTLTEGAIVAVLGPSGSGKSTLLRILSGLIPPTAGEVLWRGTPIQEAAPHIGIVFQSFALFPWLTVTENVEVPLVARG